ncbi:hypothetical protein L1987_35451 [Smallanthus sonchifolius]|uniref:Uncharacterized protein n=1 Tax=Smallanthus sonchifolius TaxID=185202 RepID=A0ACB9HY45_9ASTR|nr:hypothetical protein L1987_35451 [Smallanthus sonchifolius]
MSSDDLSDNHHHTDGEENGDTQNNHNSSLCKKINLLHIDIRSEFSDHNRTVARINNGSFGSCPTFVIEAQRRYQLRFFQQFDDFFLNHLKPRYRRHVIEVKIQRRDTAVKWSFFESKFNAATPLSCSTTPTAPSRSPFAVIDHITSMRVVIAVKELVKLCREGGVDCIFVDAAHSIGSIELLK